MVVFSKKTLVVFLAPLLAVQVASFVQHDVVLSQTQRPDVRIVAARMAADQEHPGDGCCDSAAVALPAAEVEKCSRGSNNNIKTQTNNQNVFGSNVITTRRKAISGFVGTAATTTACCCCCLPSNPAFALAQLTAPPADSLQQYDLPRNALQDAAFARGMAVGMMDYEKAAYPTKKKLFQQLFGDLSGVKEPTLVEIGIGSFPNAPYYTPRFGDKGGLDIIGVDPNDKMEGYARTNVDRAGLQNNAVANSLRIVHGVSEALPLEDNSCDAVVCSLTLCSVYDPVKSVMEIKRVLKPGGKFLFWEHVLSETDPALGIQQIAATPMQVRLADGCHLDRRTGETIKQAGFAALDLEYLELKNFGYLNPTVCGIATA